MSSDKEDRDNIHETVEMVENHIREPARVKSGTAGKSKKKKVRPFLTSSQLSDLFTRLDKNGDGELDLDEFTGIIRMLKLNVSEDYIAKVFRAVDTEASGTLEMQEFICAYQKIYCNSDVSEKAKTSAEFIRATRYGVDENGVSIFTLFTIMSHDGKSEGRKITFNIGTNPENDLKELEHYYNTAVTEKFAGGMEEINKMIAEDSRLNTEHNCRLLWWVDIALEWVERSNVNKYVAALGLPNNSKFLSSFGSFGNALPKDKKSRVFVGDGVTEEGNVSSMNVFAQTTRLKNRPVVHHLPSWLEKVLYCGNNSLFDFMGNYYISRFAFMFNLSMFSDTNKNEKMVAYEIAETMSHRLREESSAWNEDDDEGDEGQGRQGRPGKKGSNTDAIYSILKSGGKSVPFTESERHRTQPTWTLSNSQLQGSPPSIALETIGLHILDQGAGPNALVTIRRIDGEKRNDLNWEEKSRCGVLGRMLDGVWTKLLEVTCSGGVAVVAGEIDDSSHTLASFILMLTHSFSMATLGSLDYWINIIEREIKDMVVSKHSTHVAEMERLVKELSTYVDPCLSVYDEFLKDCEKEYSKTQEIANNKTPKKRGRSVVILDTSSIGAPTSVNSDKLPITYNLVKRFCGEAAHRDFRFVLDGYELLDMKGLVYWRERLDRYSQKLNATKDLIQNQLDEKRNFTSFMLTIVTTVLAPLAVLTGYFGMNFDNMDELTSETYEYAPGVTLMWVIAGITYGLMLIFSIHFRIIYSAT